MIGNDIVPIVKACIPRQNTRIGLFRIYFFQGGGVKELAGPVVCQVGSENGAEGYQAFILARTSRCALNITLRLGGSIGARYRGPRSSDKGLMLPGLPAMGYTTTRPKES